MDENEARLEAGDNVAAQSSSTLRVNSGSLLGQRQHVITTGVENSTLVERQRLQTSGVLGMGHVQRLGLTVGYEGTLIFRAKFASATAQLLSS